MRSPAQAVTDDKRRKTIQKAVDKEKARRAPIAAKLEAEPDLEAHLRARVDELARDVARLEAADDGGQC